ncbi:MAG: hypothetical protein CMH83_10515 [Nocardioides sp.]|nr:hypothetical protein [Nocardioides sp.]
MPIPEYDDFVDGVRDWLVELNLDEHVVSQIVDALDDAHGLVPDDTTMPAVPDGIFGDLPAGTELSTHTGAAYRFLMEAMADMRRTLKAYDGGVHAFRDGNVTADQWSADQTRAMQRAIEVGQHHGSGHGTGHGSSSGGSDDA